MKNRYEIRNDHVCIYITRTDGSVYECLVDLEDLPIADSWHGMWCVSEDGNGKMYVRNHNRQKLHRVLMGEPNGIVDHKDRNTLNNRRKTNLRVVSKSDNNFNLDGARKNSKTGIRGVALRTDGRYDAVVRKNGRRVLNRTYKTMLEATMAVVACRNSLSREYIRSPISIN